MVRLLPASLLAVLAVLLASGLAQPRPALACSLAGVQLDLAAELAEIVIVGEVTAERVIEPTYPTYESTIRPAAVLKGAPPGELVISPLGYLGPDCSGGPRLAVGERVLLFVGRGIIGTQGDGDLQVVGYEDGKYALENGYAKIASHEQPIPAEQAIRQVAAITGAPEEQVAAALAFARGEAAPTPSVEAEPIATPSEDADEDFPWLVVGLSSAAGAAVLLAGLLILLRARRAH